MASVLGKQEVVEAVAAKLGATKVAVKSTIDALQEVIVENLKKGNDVALIGFLTLKVVETKARKGKNPATGDEISIPAGKKVSAKLGKAVKESVKTVKAKKK
ncbi:MAG: HU family DNA-binding protein [Rickettsiales bacterium]|nr:MAG: HU family DNA-binding protein [Rickettsiales bacterium]